MIWRALLGFLPKFLLGLLDRWGWRRAGVESERRKQAEGTVKTLNEREEVRKEVRDESDDALIDRLSK